MADLGPRAEFSHAVRLAALHIGGDGRPRLDLSDSQIAHIEAAADTYLASGLRQLAADLEEEASDIDALGVTPPWAAMYGLKVTSAAEAAVILRRAAELALRRAEGHPELPGPVAPGAPQPAVRAGDKTAPKRGHDDAC